MDELTAWLRLVRAPGLHAGILRELLRDRADAAEAAGASVAALRAAGAGDSAIAWLQRASTPSRDGAAADPVAADLRWLEQDGHHFLPYGSADYPPLLAQLEDAPIGLFVRGDPATLQLPQLAIVGSRNPTPTGRDNAAAFAAHLARCGLAITSGLAIGIDAAGHRGALETGGRTIAVCGTGLDIDYPTTHAQLAREIAAQGALVSELPPGTPAARRNFPRRNRIISGLSLGTLVVEAAVHSGSLITARLAAEQGREVFAIPGSIHNPLARGCHRLIREGAKLVETAEDIFAELRALAGSLTQLSGEGRELVPEGSARGRRHKSDARPSAVARRGRQGDLALPEPPLRGSAAGVTEPDDFRPALDKDYEILLDALGFEPASVDSLVGRTGLKADAVASMLLILELEERVESYPGGLYVRRVRKGAK